MERRNKITAVTLLAALALGFLLALTSFLGGEGQLEGALKGLVRDRDLSGFLQKAEPALNQDLDRHHLFIQLFGAYERLTGRRFVQDAVEASSIAKLSNGALNFANLGNAPVDLSAHAELTAQLRDALSAEGIPYLYVLAPQKIGREGPYLPAGVPDFGNQNADGFLSVLAENQVDALDLRPFFERSGDYGDWFFRTDHHWTPEAAFFAWQAVADRLEAVYGWATDPVVLDEGSYEKIRYEGFFLGSQGKRVGSLYGGLDGITRYSPRFETDFTYTIQGSDVVRSGIFDESLLFPERVAERDLFGGNPYTLYAGGDYGFARIANHQNPEGPRILLIRDSFACAFAPFLALSCSELITVDLRYLPEGTLLDAVREARPDLVMTLYTTGTNGVDSMFSYFPPQEQEQEAVS